MRCYIPVLIITLSACATFDRVSEHIHRQKLDDIRKKELKNVESIYHILALYKPLCDGGSVQACFDFVFLKVFKSQRTIYEPLPIENACLEEGHLDSCFFLAWMWQTGYQHEHDIAQAIKFYRHACERDHGESCNELGVIFWKGKGTQKNLDIASALFDQACAIGRREGCINRRVIEKEMMP